VGKAQLKGQGLGGRAWMVGKCVSPLQRNALCPQLCSPFWWHWEPRLVFGSRTSVLAELTYWVGSFNRG